MKKRLTNRIIELLEQYEPSCVDDFKDYMAQENPFSEDEKALHWILAKVPRVPSCKASLKLYSFVTGKSENYFKDLFSKEKKVMSQASIHTYVPLDIFKFDITRKVLFGLEIQTVIESDVKGICESSVVRFPKHSSWVSVKTFISGDLASENVYYRRESFERISGNIYSYHD